MNPLVEPGPNAQALADLTVLSEISGRVDVTSESERSLDTDAHCALQPT